MVSLRRRRLLGLCSGRNSFLSPLTRFFGNGSCTESPIQHSKSISVHPLPFGDANQPRRKTSVCLGPGSSDTLGSTSPKELHNEQYSEQPIKRRKRHRRKHVQNQEPCLMRGVYFKNMKWQAAIKVDKKQIHLGTVGSQEEAANLYDRAAFMCGREPNFELSEEEKQELRNFDWDEFLAYTRRSINNKKHKRRLRAGMEKKSEPSEVSMQSSDWDSKQGVNGFSGSEDADPDSSVS
ncbi:ethylene-responsive transcription factor-like protein At4g13040 [Tripterygium wilfordii]|uniref:ethylene-responsive transcription factor-like protein At4g13040 n=1 Tax=Tripterygium wilfordii TaxID=458696 RepID=UPI0018F841F9|nr:ethylene-responsive transcription factor-like protein At4g13040 [Tripterygium wilfordii]